MPDHDRVLCNPMDLPYRLQDLSLGKLKRWVHREAADPSVVLFQGRYFMFPSMSAGFWHSTDLLEWEFVATPELPNYDYAPDVHEIDGALVVCASKPKGICDFYRSKDPLSGAWEQVPGTFTFWDPAVFQDDDGRVYIYWGCSATDPIRGVELDPATFERIGSEVDLFDSDKAAHGWERIGENFNPKDLPGALDKVTALAYRKRPFLEGAWMTKHAGRYYLQYSAPGTQLNTYSDGWYVGDAPLGPFTYSPHSPFSSKPGGFITAAGHGSTFEDVHGNWWHVASMRISKNYMFERRLGLFPAGFDADGVLFCNQEFADYPMVVPDGPADPWSLSARWMLLSYKRPVTASSFDPAHAPALAVDEDIRTWWKAADAAPGHTLTVELAEGSSVAAVQVNLFEDRLRPPRPAKDQRVKTPVGRRTIDTTDHPAEFLLEGSTDGRTWTVLRDTRGLRTNRTHDWTTLEAPAAYRYVRLTGFAQAHGAPFTVSGLRVFGHGAGEPPAAVTPSARRTGPLNALLSWDAVTGAQGYNVRYGLTPDTLYKSWQLYDQTSLDLGALNAGHAYWVAVDSFNENGITRGEPVRVAADRG